MESQRLFQEHLNIPWTAPVPEAAGCFRGGHTSTLRQSVYFLWGLEDDSRAHWVFFCRCSRGALSQEEELFTYRLHEPRKYCFISAKWAARSPSSLCCCLQIQEEMLCKRYSCFQELLLANICLSEAERSSVVILGGLEKWRWTFYSSWFVSHPNSFLYVPRGGKHERGMTKKKKKNHRRRSYYRWLDAKEASIDDAILASFYLFRIK